MVSRPVIKITLDCHILKKCIKVSDYTSNCQHCFNASKTFCASQCLRFICLAWLIGKMFFNDYQVSFIKANFSLY